MILWLFECSIFIKPGATVISFWTFELLSLSIRPSQSYVRNVDKLSLDFNSWYSITSRSIVSRDEHDEDEEEVEFGVPKADDIEDKGKDDNMGSNIDTGVKSVS